MAVREIVLYPDPGLLKPTNPVPEVDDGVRRLVADMVDTMNDAPGIGLAANQVGASSRVCIVDLSSGDDPEQLLVLINPRIVGVDGHEVAEEGCLSFPDILIDVPRPARVTVRALDLGGQPFELTADGLFGRAIQHEIEHLEGRVFLHNLSPLKREMVKRRIKKKIQAGEWASPALP